MTPERKKLALTTSFATVYTVPTGKTSVISNIHVANIDGTNEATCDVQWLDDEDSDTAVLLAKVVPVPAGDAVTIGDGGFVLKAGDVLQAKASAASDLMLTIRITEFDTP
jgi:hypothetical protein